MWTMPSRIPGRKLRRSPSQFVVVEVARSQDRVNPIASPFKNKACMLVDGGTNIVSVDVRMAVSSDDRFDDLQLVGF